MEQRNRRGPVNTAVLQGWVNLVFEDHHPSSQRHPPYDVEVAAFADWGFNYNVTRDADRSALQNVSWTWSTACAWIAWQTLEGAALGVAAFRTWRGRIWREGEFELRPGRLMTMADAQLVLLNALQSGDMTADAVRDGYVMSIGRSEWPRLAWETNSHGEVIEFDRLLMLGAPRYEGVTLPRAAMMHLWPALDGWAPDGFAGTVEDAPAAGAAPLDVEFREMEEGAPGPELAALTGPPGQGTALPKGTERQVKRRQGKREGKGQTEAALKARAEQPARREAVLRRLLAERGGSLTVTQAQHMLKAELGEDFPASRGTVQADLAAIRAADLQKK